MPDLMEGQSRHRECAQEAQTRRRIEKAPPNKTQQSMTHLFESSSILRERSRMNLKLLATPGRRQGA